MSHMGVTEMYIFK